MQDVSGKMPLTSLVLDDLLSHVHWSLLLRLRGASCLIEPCTETNLFNAVAVALIKAVDVDSV